jgi:hypothetical protein
MQNILVFLHRSMLHGEATTYATQTGWLCLFHPLYQHLATPPPDKTWHVYCLVSCESISSPLAHLW